MNGEEGANSPVFSSDGQWIGFFADSKLRKIAVRGGVSLPLGDAIPRGASWGDDGNIIVAGLTEGLARIPSAGGRPTPATELKKGERAHHWPQILPGSHSVLFTVHTGDDSDIDLISFPSGQRQTLFHGGSYGRYLPSGHLVYPRDNTLFAAPFDLRLAHILSRWPLAGVLLE